MCIENRRVKVKYECNALKRSYHKGKNPLIAKSDSKNLARLAFGYYFKVFVRCCQAYYQSIRKMIHIKTKEMELNKRPQHLEQK